MCKRTSLLLFYPAAFPRMERFNMKYIDEEDTVMNFTHLVGNTPMIRIRYKLDGREGFVWAKLEAYNLSGSIKDRLAAHVITKSTANGTLKPGQDRKSVV